MQIKIPLISLLILIGSTVIAQTYQVNQYGFIDNQEAVKYYNQVNLPVKYFSSSMKEMLSNEYRTFSYKLKKNNGDLIMTISGGKGEHEIPMEKIAKNIYSFSKGNDSIIVDLNKHTPKLYIDMYKPLKKTVGQENLYNEMLEKYGEKIQLYRLNLDLAEVSETERASQLNLIKSFKVNKVKLVKDEDVISFADEYVNTDFYAKNYKFNQETLEKMFLGTEYSLTIDGIRIEISESNENSSNSFSSVLEKQNEDKYRCKIGNTFYDFFIDSTSKNSFDVQRIEYTQFFLLKEAYKNTDEYKSLKKKYGEEVPYYTIVLSVDEILSN